MENPYARSCRKWKNKCHQDICSKQYLLLSDKRWKRKITYPDCISVRKIFIQIRVYIELGDICEKKFYRNKQVECVQYLSSKLYSSHTENTVTLPILIVIKTRKWCERARNTVLLKHGAYKSSMRRRPYNVSVLQVQKLLIGHSSDMGTLYISISECCTCILMGDCQDNQIISS